MQLLYERVLRDDYGGAGSQVGAGMSFPVSAVDFMRLTPDMAGKLTFKDRFGVKEIVLGGSAALAR
jgi:hypothetical protein